MDDRKVLWNRRSFLKGAGAAVGATPLLAAGGRADDAGPDVVDAGAPMALELEVNGGKRALRVLPLTSLATALRDELQLTGTKVCCDAGSCGACTVVVDGAPLASCLRLAMDCAGSNVRTIEGLAQGGALHEVQQAFLDADALQCGYCTPGMIMASVAFVEAWRARPAARPGPPDDDDVRRALSGNLCRCGAQPQILAAVKAVCAGERARQPGPRKGHDDHALARVDGLEKVTGAARYTTDVSLPGMLHGVVVTSQVAHGAIRSVDTTRARALPGVRAIELSPIERKEGFGKLRYVGQPIAVVAADTRAAAEEAARAVVVDVAAEPSVVEPRAAARDGAPVIFPPERRGEVPKMNEGPSPPEGLNRWEGNVRGPMVWPLHSDDDSVRAAARAAPISVSLDVTTAVQAHVTLERHACVAAWEGASLTLHASTQTVQALAKDLAERLEVPAANVRVLGPYVGGGFGAKAGLRPEHVAAAKLAKTTGRPVRIVYGFPEHVQSGGNRPGTAQHLELGALRDGTIRAIHHEATGHGGLAVGQGHTTMTTTHYPTAKVHTVDRNVVTNAPPACPFRAPGHPPGAFALEQAVDEVAARLGRDPLALRAAQDDQPRRRRVVQLLQEHARVPAGALALVHRGGGTRYAHGFGTATAEWFTVLAPSARVELRAHRDGTLEVGTASHDIGQGVRTVLASVVHEALGIPAARIVVRVGDSALSSAPGTFGSCSTTSVAPAAERAVDALREELLKAARARLGKVEAGNGGVRDGQRVRPFHELFAWLPDDPTVVVGVRGDDVDGFRLPPGRYGALAPSIPFALGKDVTSSAQLVEIEVDRWTGRIRVPRVVIALDAGRIAAPRTARSQVIGAVIQGLSYALYEDRVLDEATGRSLARNFEGYPILGVGSAPDIEVHFLDERSPNNPAGVLGLGGGIL